MQKLCHKFGMILANAKIVPYIIWNCTKRVLLELHNILQQKELHKKSKIILDRLLYICYHYIIENNYKEVEQMTKGIATIYYRNEKNRLCSMTVPMQKMQVELHILSIHRCRVIKVIGG